MDTRPVTPGELRPRPAAMVDRVGAEAEPFMPREETQRLQDAVRGALLFRDPQLEDDHDTRLLHPARTVLILLRDASCRSVDVLAAAAFAESVDADLAPPLTALSRAAGAGAVAIAAAVPLPGGELLERLVTADDDVAVAALAERLDQVRHLHLRPELPWHRMHAEVEEVYMPVAHRLSPPLGRRFERWAEAFRRRLMLRPQP